MCVMHMVSTVHFSPCHLEKKTPPVEQLELTHSPVIIFPAYVRSGKCRQTRPSFFPTLSIRNEGLLRYALDCVCFQCHSSCYWK